MKVLILNGNPQAGPFDNYCAETAQLFTDAGHPADLITLRDKNINYCTGCWTCWWTTPGLCAFKDDMRDIYAQMAQAGLVIWASPLIEGAVSSLLKKAQDRFIPMAHPYTEVYKSEFHHRFRYRKNADVGLIIARSPGDTDEDAALAKKFFQRYSLNTRTNFSFFTETTSSPQEAVHETLAH